MNARHLRGHICGRTSRVLSSRLPCDARTTRTIAALLRSSHPSDTMSEGHIGHCFLSIYCSSQARISIVFRIPRDGVESLSRTHLHCILSIASCLRRFLCIDLDIITAYLNSPATAPTYLAPVVHNPPTPSPSRVPVYTLLSAVHSQCHPSIRAQSALPEEISRVPCRQEFQRTQCTTIASARPRPRLPRTSPKVTHAPNTHDTKSVR